MATFKGDVIGTSIGMVYVQPRGEVPPTETLFVLDLPTYGISLVDRSGVKVAPRSNRVGYAGRRGTSVYSLVCEDGTDPEPLIAAGYMNVIERG